MKKEYKTFDCEYMRIAEDPRYMYMHVSVDRSCMGFGNKSLMFLYNTITKEIKYSIDDRDMVSYRYGYVKDSYIEIGKKIISNDINVDEMLAYSSDDKSTWYDVVSYSVFMKSGEKTNWIHIDDPDMIQYQPFMWVIELFNLITDKIPSKKFNCGVDWEDLEKHMRENHPEL